MADNSDDEHLDNPIDTQSENPPEEITPTADTEIINPNQETENMEVHHHAHHEGKKNWKSYFWEFLMLFLAVFCGFLAEYQLEQTIERHREKEFILSMIEDAQRDTANIHEAIRLNLQRIAYADTISIICFTYKGTQKEQTQIYYAHRRSIYYPNIVHPTDRTLFQLKNSGGMRLIQKKKSAQSIIEYDKNGKMLMDQQGYYEIYLSEVTNSSSQLINFYTLFDNKTPLQNRFDSAKLIKPDEIKLLDFGNKAIMYKGILRQYVKRLKEMEKGAILLMNTLKEEYNIH